VFKLQFNEKVFCFKIFPGISGEILMETVRAKSCEGLVLEAYGAGNVPDLDHSILGMIKEARGLKKPVVISSQCPDGKVDLSKYLCGRKAEAAGAISGGSMTTEACVVKLMHGMGIGLEGAALKNYFKANICGEQGENSI
jgi:L-asparaginase